MNNIMATINNMTICARNDGRYMGRLTINSNRKSFYGKTKTEVKNKAKDYLNKIEEGYVEPENILLKDYMEEWLMKHKYGKIEPSSFTRLYRVYDCQIKDSYIGQQKLGCITTEMIQNMIDKHAYPIDDTTKPLARSGLKRLIQIIRPCMARAVKDGIIKSNPADDVVVPSDSYIKTSTRKQLTLSDEQIEELKEASLSRYKNGEYKSRDALVLMVILNLGLRAGEALALEWGNVDYENKLIYINNTVQSNIYDIKTKKLYNRVKESPKTKSGIRVLKLNDTTIFYLKELQNYDKRKNIVSDYIASTNVGTRNTYRNLERSLKRVISNTNLPQGISLHTLRHTFGSTLIRRGVSVEVVSKLMGHANIMITYNKYIHVLKEQEALAMDMITIS